MVDKPNKIDARQTDDKTENNIAKIETCGIVMPIASMGDEYSLEHWRRVKKILERAIERSGLRAQLVWENPEVDIIQSAILQNIYENEVVICDVSNLNPNVMLETGLRLSTKRPTIIVTDEIKRPPFDISTIGYIPYQKDLEYNSIEDFIGKLVTKIQVVCAAAKSGNYKSFVENYRFETVMPATVNVTQEEYMKEQFMDLRKSIARIERNSNLKNTEPKTPMIIKTYGNDRVIRFEYHLYEPQMIELAEIIESMDGVNLVIYDAKGNGAYDIAVALGDQLSAHGILNLKNQISKAFQQIYNRSPD